jgi:predicted metallopeptidase
MQIKWQKAPDIKKRIASLLVGLEINNFDKSSIYCFRSMGANTHAIARIWGLSRIWQEALNLKPSYIIEVISEKFDRMSFNEQDKVLLHDLAHIPQNHGKRSFRKKVETFIDKIMYKATK